MSKSRKKTEEELKEEKEFKGTNEEDELWEEDLFEPSEDNSFDDGG